MAGLFGLGIFSTALYALLEPSLAGSAPRVVIYVVAPALAGATLLVIGLMRKEWSVLALVYLAAIGVAVFMAELYLSFAKVEPPALTQPARDPDGEPFVCALSFPPSEEVFRLGGAPARHLSGISGSRLGSAGDGTVRNADERGFNNPPGLWPLGVADVLAVGDSFTFGADVPIGEGFVDHIRRRIPSTVNLGCGGNGPLTELGSLVEYGPALRPRVVLWVYFEGNDLHKDIYTELQSPVLSRYLENGFKQGLVDRQSEVDRGLRAALGRLRPTGPDRPELVTSNLQARLTLTELRTALGLRHRIKPEALELFERILGRAKELAAAWDGKLVLVILPAETRYVSRIARADAHGYGAKVLELAVRRGIPVIDVAAGFERERDPRGLYRGHFTVEGYAKVSEFILNDLTRLGLKPTP